MTDSSTASDPKSKDDTLEEEDTALLPRPLDHARRQRHLSHPHVLDNPPTRLTSTPGHPFSSSKSLQTGYEKMEDGAAAKVELTPLMSHKDAEKGSPGTPQAQRHWDGTEGEEKDLKGSSDHLTFI